MKRLSIIIVTFFLFSFCVFNQTLQNDIIATAGESDTTGEMLVSWTIGEPFINTYRNPVCIITQGFHQSFFRFTEIPEIGEVLFEVEVYPNPTSGFVYVIVHSGELNGHFEIELTDMQGKLLQKYLLVREQRIHIDLRNTSASMILMSLIHPASKTRRTFKIVKTNP